MVVKKMGIKIVSDSRELNREDMSLEDAQKQFNEMLNKFFIERNETVGDSSNSIISRLSMYKMDIDSINRSVIEYLKSCKDRRLISEQVIPTVENIEDLVKNPNIESVSFNPDEKEFIVITKPIIIWKWNLGQYKITYSWNRRNPLPDITRIQQYNEDYTLLIPYPESEFMISGGFEHPHIHMNPCFGDTTRLINTFWNNPNEGINYCIQYLKCYSRRNAYIQLDRFLALIGYINDGSILLRNPNIIERIDNGICYDRRGNEVTPEMLEEMGCNGKIVTKDEMEKYIEESRYNKKRIALEEGFEYVPNINSEFMYLLEDESEYVCEDCGDQCDDVYEVQDNYICESCYENNTSYCEECECNFYNDNVNYYDNAGMTLCNSCAREILSMCYGCLEDYKNDDLNYNDDTGEFYCDTCYTEHIRNREREQEKNAEDNTEDDTEDNTEDNTEEPKIYSVRRITQ